MVCSLSISLSKRKWATKKKNSSQCHTDKPSATQNLDFIDEEVMIAGSKSRLLKMVIRKLSTDDFDTPDGKKKLSEIHEFLMSAHVESSI